jgi:NADPH-dependent 2,4-dienoyl-CoA reductase/sulfur reductase-like enzyme
MKGHDVTVAEMTDRVAADANARQRPALIEKLYALCRVVTGVKGLYADENGLVCDNGTTLKADTIVAAAGQRPLYESVDALRNTAPEVRLVATVLKLSISVKQFLRAITREWTYSLKYYLLSKYIQTTVVPRCAAEY